MVDNPFQAMNDLMKNMQAQSGYAPGAIDKESMMKAHRKNMESLTEANKMAVEVMKNIATLQSQYIKKTFEDMTEIMKSFMKADVSKEANQDRTDLMRNQMHRVFDHSSGISDLIARSQRDMIDRMYDRYNEGASELSDVVKKPSRTKH